MQVWVQPHRLPPGMQHGDHARLCAQPFCIFANTADRGPYAAKQNIVHHCGLVQEQGVKRIGQCEHYMKIKIRSKVLSPGLLSTFLFLLYKLVIFILINHQIYWPPY